MKPKRVCRREQADRDIEEAIGFYLEQAAPDAALKFVDALERAIGHIARHPPTGSPRYAHELGLAGLRCWPLKRFPYLVFYVEYSDYIDVWRILHGRRDIPAWLHAED